MRIRRTGRPHRLGNGCGPRMSGSNVDVLGSRLNEIVARSETLSGRKDAIRRSVEKLLEQAENAANGDNPIFLWVRSWWRGTLIEAAYQNLHAAEAEIVPLYDQFEVDAEFPEAVATVDASLNRDDPRRLTARSDIAAESLDVRRAKLRKLIETGHTAIERQHTRLRSFRNIIVMTAILIGVLVLAFISAVAVDPASVPLCFKPPPGTFVFPAGRPEPSAHDVMVVALLGSMGGALAAAVSIRNLKGNVNALRRSGGPGIAQGLGRRADGDRGDHRHSRQIRPGTE
jgi:hypothetical protein